MSIGVSRSEHFLHEQGVAEGVATTEPFVETSRLHEAGAAKEGLGGLVVGGHKGRELVEGKVVGAVFAQQRECLGGQPLPLPLGQEDDAHLGPQVAGMEVLEVDEALDNAVGSLDDEPQLTVLVDVVLTLGNKLPEGIGREGGGGLALGPQAGVVLDEVHQVEVFGFGGPQRDSLGGEQKVSG